MGQVGGGDPNTVKNVQKKNMHSYSWGLQSKREKGTCYSRV